MNHFSIQTCNPVFQNLKGEQVDYLYEAIEKIFSINTEEAYLLWNWIPVRINYTYDLYVVIDDILKLLNSLLDSDKGSCKVFWGSNTLNSEWSLDWFGDRLTIDSKWNMVAGNYENLLNDRSRLEVQKNIFLYEWKSFFLKMIEAIDRSEIMIVNSEKLELLRNTETSIENLGRLYSQ